MTVKRALLRKAHIRNILYRQNKHFPPAARDHLWFLLHSPRHINTKAARASRQRSKVNVVADFMPGGYIHMYMYLYDSFIFTELPTQMHRSVQLNLVSRIKRQCSRLRCDYMYKYFGPFLVCVLRKIVRFIVKIINFIIKGIHVYPSKQVFTMLSRVRFQDLVN